MNLFSVDLVRVLPCCPHCGKPLPLSRLFWKTWIFSRWKCENCDTHLRFDLKRRLWIANFGVFYISLSFSCLFLYETFLSGTINWWMVIPLLIPLLFLSFLDKAREDSWLLSHQKDNPPTERKSNVLFAPQLQRCRAWGNQLHRLFDFRSIDSVRSPELFSLASKFGECFLCGLAMGFGSCGVCQDFFVCGLCLLFSASRGQCFAEG